MANAPGILTLPSPYSVAETLDRLQALLTQKGIKIFIRIDQAAEARAAGLSMPEIQLLIFGSPKGGTPIMIQSPVSGLDLPLKALAWQHSDGHVFLSYNDPEYFRNKYNLSEEAVKPISGVGNLIEQVLRA